MFFLCFSVEGRKEIEGEPALISSLNPQPSFSPLRMPAEDSKPDDKVPMEDVDKEDAKKKPEEKKKGSLACVPPKNCVG